MDKKGIGGEVIERPVKVDKSYEFVETIHKGLLFTLYTTLDYSI